MQQFSRRMKKILECILENNSIKADELAERFGISKRTLYYDLSNINYSLSEMKLPGIISGAQGFYIENNQKDVIVRMLGIHQFHEYVSSSNERCYRILWRIMNEKNNTKFSDVQEDLGVSRNTAVNDMKAVRALLGTFGLQLISKNGYHITGDEVHRRILYSALFNDYGYLIPDHSIQDLGGMVDEEYIRKYLSAFYLYAWRNVPVDYGCVRSYLCGQDNDSLHRFEEKCEMSIDPSEAGFVELAMKDNYRLIEIFKSTELDRYLHYAGLIGEIIGEFEKLSCIHIDEKEVLKNRILEHLIPYIVRSRVGIYGTNGMKEQIRKKYPVVYKLTETAIQPYQKSFENFIFNDDMIAYLVLYFGAVIHDSHEVQSLPRILIVCNKGYATSQLLAQQIREIFSNVEITGVVSSSQIDMYEGRYDYIVTSERMLDDEKVIRVNPFLTAADESKLLYRIADLRQVKNRKYDIEGIAEKLSESVTIHDRAKMISDLKVLLNTTKDSQDRISPHIWEVADSTMFQVVEGFCEWKDAIKIGSRPLLQDRRIRESYIQAMIDSTEENGPYMIVGEDLALAHASPLDGVDRLGISLTVFKEPVKLEEKYFKVLIVLAPVDKKRHMTLLADINRIISDKEKYEALKTVQSSPELCEMVCDRRMN